MSGEFERRAAGLEVRARGRRLEGYAALFGVEARICEVVETIQQTASTESIGDGKIFVLDLASATRIRTGESGETAL